LPGLINAVNPSIEVGVGVHPYQFGWLLGFFATSGVYLGLSWWFPAVEASIERAVLPDEVYEESVAVVMGVETHSSSGENVHMRVGKGGFESEKVV